MRAVCQITVVPSAAFQIAIPANYQRNLLGLTAVPTINLSMGYQALLFCPDEKTARTVTQVLSELDFSVDPCNEPFAAVKKLMAQHFDAIVVDCDNEQNAALLFKGARGSASNQMSLAVAVVEGQAGVAKASIVTAGLNPYWRTNNRATRGLWRATSARQVSHCSSRPGAQSFT